MRSVSADVFGVSLMVRFLGCDLLRELVQSQHVDGKSAIRVAANPARLEQ